MQSRQWKIVTSPDEMKEGLFGQVLLWILEILPYLEDQSIFPDWEIKSRLYGNFPEYTVVPGVFDLAYMPPQNINKMVRLIALRTTHTYTLGGDWDYVHRLWNSYFTIPNRIISIVNQIKITPHTLGLHYRGTDKNQSLSDTNPVSQSVFLMLVEDFLREHQDINSIFVATDEASFIQNVQARFSHLEIINLGKIEFHKTVTNGEEKADRALTDCFLLSRCRYLLKCSSALSAFAKILNPQLEAYRVSACKFNNSGLPNIPFFPRDIIPYFPDAFIPKLTSTNPECSQILKNLFTDDWLDNNESTIWQSVFKSQMRFTKYEKVKNLINFSIVDFIKSILIFAKLKRL